MRWTKCSCWRAWACQNRGFWFKFTNKKGYHERAVPKLLDFTTNNVPVVYFQTSSLSKLSNLRHANRSISPKRQPLTLTITYSTIPQALQSFQYCAILRAGFDLPQSLQALSIAQYCGFHFPDVLQILQKCNHEMPIIQHYTAYNIFTHFHLATYLCFLSYASNKILKAISILPFGTMGHLLTIRHNFLIYIWTFFFYLSAAMNYTSQNACFSHFQILTLLELWALILMSQYVLIDLVQLLT